MSIEISGLTKAYDQQLAVDSLTFSAGQGEIVGFLGPNGAGKSTTMKIIAGYISPTSGSVKVCGYDVVEDSINVRKCIGYLPEHNPLYLDMYVHEYLHFIGSLHISSRKILRDKVPEMVALCGLEKEQNKLIRSLSKGYRQRVGLAQAMLHDPQVLILDEPTTGLDPNQIIEIRELIRSVSVEKTVIFSTHIMQEVQALCSRVLIINQGKLVADDKPEELKSVAAATVVITVEFREDIATDEISALEGVLSVRKNGKIILVEASAESDVRPLIFSFAKTHGYTLLGMNQEASSMEDVFRQLTRKS
ncbi:MAG: gliding motility-associated ABC transporter ATP-binding subunit GldA [Cyclobacteriaceae bacterium]|nr:gliding motility-associated ABC transporter ATP-binding subunit GldA [Cyclobacteriaceae bacterium]